MCLKYFSNGMPIDVEWDCKCINQHVAGENYVCIDAGELSLTDESKMMAWVEHHARLLNVEFEWPSNKLHEVSPAPTPVCPWPWSTTHLARCEIFVLPMWKTLYVAIFQNAFCNHMAWCEGITIISRIFKNASYQWVCGASVFTTSVQVQTPSSPREC